MQEEREEVSLPRVGRLKEERGRTDERHTATAGWRGVSHWLVDTRQGTDSGQPESDPGLRVTTLL